MEENIENSEKECICCGSNKFKPFNYNNYGYGKLKGKDNIFENLEIKCCINCGFSFSSPRLTEPDLVYFYKFHYSSPGTMHSISWDQKLANYKKEFSPRAVAQIHLVKVFKDINEIESVLEIGPGEGNFIKYLKKFKKEISYFVFEEDSTKFKLLKNLGAKFLKIESGSFCKKKYLEKFDLTIMSHSLEHFQSYQILKILDDIYKMTKKGGALLIEVPNENFFKHSKNQNHSPHLSFFNLMSFTKLIENTNFEILFIKETGPKIKNFDHHRNINIFKKKFKKYFLLVKTFRLIKSIINLMKVLFCNFYYNFFSNSTSVLQSKDFDYGKDRDNLRCLLIKR